RPRRRCAGGGHPVVVDGAAAHAAAGLVVTAVSSAAHRGAAVVESRSTDSSRIISCRHGAQYSSAEITSPPPMVPRARQAAPLMASLTNLTDPSPIRQLTPPGW